MRVPHGSLTVVTGPSGCGKTTLLRMIAGLERPTSGRVVIGDRDVTHLPPHRRNVAMQFQEFPLYPHLTVERNLRFVLRQRRVPREDAGRRLSEIAARLRIDGLLARYPGELSGGERQRAALARVLIAQPAVALFDEPLSNLDASLRATLRDELRDLHRSFEVTRVHVTHDQEEAAFLADQLAVMACGRIQQVGTPQHVHDQPTNRFVASFIGSPRMNLIDGRVIAEDGRLRFVSDGGWRADLSDDGGVDIDVSAADRFSLGVRPHHVEFAAARPGTPRDGVIERIEHLGAQRNIVVQLGSGDQLIATRGDASIRWKPGDPVAVRLAPEHVHCFACSEFGARLNIGASPAFSTP